MIRALLVALFLALPHGAAQASVHNDVTAQTIRIQERDRSYLLYVPANVEPKAPVLVLLHGSGDSGARMREKTARAFEPIAQANGFLVVYPDGFGNHWNDCRAKDDFSARKENIDDEAFILAIGDRLARDYGSDPNALVVLGYSNGGQMAMRMGLMHPDRVRAITAISASMPTPENMICTPSQRPVPAMVINGTADRVNPFRGGEVRLGNATRGDVLSSEATARYFARRDGLDTVSFSGSVAPPAPSRISAVELASWGPVDAPRVVHVTLHNGGHTIPSKTAPMPWYTGERNNVLSLPLAIWDFFADALRPRPAPAVAEVPKAAPAAPRPVASIPAAGLVPAALRPGDGVQVEN
ncbi:alpha/beta hydrolase family esterase [Zavarzinia sp. CC-PAN008]|uniref:alpha/beta hydrolase family esterase n=1 Tax=Zavarzinia sp. CC-PAN008 TaxID=3243332 RepID=UPI003F7499ED